MFQGGAEALEGSGWFKEYLESRNKDLAHGCEEGGKGGSQV
jgi:hypothetical protein